MTCKRNFINVFTLWTILLLLGVLPRLLKGLTGAGSNAVGILLFTLIAIPFIYKYTTALKKIPRKIIFFMGALVMYMLIQIIFIGEWSQKSYNSLLLLLYFFLVAFVSATWLKNNNIKILLSAIKILAVVLAIIGFFNIFTDYRLATIYNSSKSVFPFGEPSHYSLFSGMFFLVYFVISNKLATKIAIIIIATLLAVLFPNTTMLIFVVLMIVLLIKFSIKNIILFFGAIYIIFNLFSNMFYFSDRIDFSNTDNISTLVYLQGIDYAKRALPDTNGLGLGFQMMGSQKTSELTYQIIKLAGMVDNEGLNRQDGGFLAAKVITEFGVFGISMLIGYLYLFFKSFLYLKKFMSNMKYDRDQSTYKLAIAHAILFSFSIEIFVRGTGYFTPTVFIFLMALVYLIKYKPHKIQENIRL